MLALTHESWARDFMFKLNPEADVGILTSPGQLQYAILVETNASVFETDGQYGGMFNNDFFLRWLIVPVVTVDSITAEIVVQADERISNEHCVKVRGISTLIRMIRSNKDGSVLFCMENPEHDEIALNFFTCTSQASRKRHYMRAKRGDFLDALLDPQGIDFQKMTRALSLIELINERYNCSGCAKAAPGLGCFCPLDLKRPLHPLDFATSRKNMDIHAGRFSGNCTFALLSQGIQSTTAMLASTITTNIVKVPGLIESVAENGIKSRMNTGMIVPQSFPSPPVNVDPALSFSKPNHVPGIHFNSPMNSFDRIISLPSGDSWLGEPLGSTKNFLPLPSSEILCIDAAPSTVRHTTMSASAEDQKSKEAADRKLRRQIKNREAAARSNRRRKERNDALKENLFAARKKKNELEQRESELKSENATLRTLVGK